MAIENNITVFTVIWIYLSKGDRERERERERVALDFHIAVSYVYLNWDARHLWRCNTSFYCMVNVDWRWVAGVCVSAWVLVCVHFVCVCVCVYVYVCAFLSVCVCVCVCLNIIHNSTHVSLQTLGNLCEFLKWPLWLMPIKNLPLHFSTSQLSPIFKYLRLAHLAFLPLSLSLSSSIHRDVSLVSFIRSGLRIQCHLVSIELCSMGKFSIVLH